MYLSKSWRNRSLHLIAASLELTAVATIIVKYVAKCQQESYKLSSAHGITAV